MHCGCIICLCLFSLPYSIAAIAAETPQPGLSEEVIARIENSVCILAEDGKIFGSGFAVSSKRVLTAAHHWEEGDDEDGTRFAVAVGDQVQCIHGKPAANRRYNLQVVKLDQHLDYCILELIGDSTFSEWTETDVSPNLKLTTPVFLASHQIGIQQHLDTYNMGVSLGIANGIIMRRSDRHMVHSCSAFKGDSGGAIVINNGKVIGLHIASVNEAKHLLDVNEIDFGSVAESINQLCDAQSSGSIALLVSAIEC
jgi:Trypsin-like peptidase domain